MSMWKVWVLLLGFAALTWYGLIVLITSLMESIGL